VNWPKNICCKLFNGCQAILAKNIGYEMPVVTMLLWLRIFVGNCLVIAKQFLLRILAAKRLPTTMPLLP
jgi:hypothetical protein